MINRTYRYQSTIDGLQRIRASSLDGRGYSPTIVNQFFRGFSMLKRSMVAVVDDDESVRESLPDLLNELGFTAQTFASAADFLSSDSIDQTRCLILDVAMPGMSGLELQSELKLRGYRFPIIFITAHRDGRVRPSVLQQGAVDCLFKPFSDTALLEALNAALQRV
jgi:FixJ family two-component response regulator